MKIKRICSVALAGLMLTSSVGVFAGEVYVNGEKLESSSRVVDGEVYVSIKEMGQALGAEVTVDENSDASMKFKEDDAIVKMIEKVSESVVAIVGNYSSSGYSSDVLDYNELYGHGAGVVIEEDGMILTNAHVIDEMQNITVIFGGGETYSGKVLYSDEESDLAVVKISKTGLKPITFAEENSLKIGETVVAIGTPLSISLINSASKGIVSGTGVNISQHYLFTQSDVAINGGNSGGPLVNLEGELVGINSIKYVGSDVEGMSFSIPVDTINYVLDSFENYGRVVRPDTGITFTESWESKIGVPTTKGLTVTASGKENIQAGDMITHVNGSEVHSVADYNEVVKKSFNGENLTFTYTRAGETFTVEIETKIDLSKDLGDKVEISLQIGNNVIVINGNEVEIEAPYIAGDGTTLVPLRVVSEAFGAGVIWTDETQEIFIEYPDVEIQLAIGNNVAIVNEEEVTLPVAPELKNDTTMVPLRFISEMFGATVEYIHETNTVTVEKEAEIGSETISFSTDLPRIGDSYHNWSMLTPTSMMMTDREFDGSSTYFFDENGYLIINIEDREDEYDEEDEESEEEFDPDEFFDEVYQEAKNSASYGATLSKNEKGTDSLGNKCFRITARSKSYVEDMYAVVVGKKIYTVAYYCDVGSGAIATLTSLLESFKVEFAANDEEKAKTYDLSNVGEDGYRDYEDEDLKLKFRMPADFSSDNYYYYQSMNELSYSDDDNNAVYVHVYSKSETVTSESYITNDNKEAKDYSNPKLFTISEVLPYDLTEIGENAYYYTVKSEGLTDGDYIVHCVVFEIGEYVYDLTVVDYSEEQELFTKVSESFEADKLDSEELGVILYEFDEEGEGEEFSEGDWSITMPAGWDDYYLEEDYADFEHEDTLSEMYYEKMSYTDVNYTSAKNAATSIHAEFIKNEDEYYESVESVEAVTSKNIGDYTFYTFTVKYTYESYYSDYSYTKYDTVYVMEKGRNLHAFTLSTDENHAFGKLQTDIEEALATFTTK